VGPGARLAPEPWRAVARLPCGGLQTRTLAALVVAAAATAVVGLLLLGREASEGGPQPRTTTEQALAAFMRDRFGTRYVGTCPQKFPPDGDIPRGMCSARFSGTARRAVYGIGPPFSEGAGEATLVRDPSGSWRVANFEEYPPLGAGWSGRDGRSRPALVRGHLSGMRLSLICRTDHGFAVSGEC